MPRRSSIWATLACRVPNKQCMKQQADEGTRTYAIVSPGEKGRPADSAGQSGDTQGLPDVAEAGSESVTELIEEGQSFEAEAIGGVEDAPDPDVAEVHTRQFPEGRCASGISAERLGRRLGSRISVEKAPA
jgi:hypothetical protein